ncbi:hypothetical protein [Ferrimicrobium sp.]|uniref:hypothetical protein n=1 Tax=Ferrimicrobium sp. TaxID=2926050 RepID=UPI0026220E37|nr:hypothetical protein [Ferrimicrobium sp.]
MILEVATFAVALVTLVLAIATWRLGSEAFRTRVDAATPRVSIFATVEDPRPYRLLDAVERAPGGMVEHVGSPIAMAFAEETQLWMNDDKSILWMEVQLVIANYGPGTARVRFAPVHENVWPTAIDRWRSVERRRSDVVPEAELKPRQTSGDGYLQAFLAAGIHQIDGQPIEPNCVVLPVNCVATVATWLGHGGRTWKAILDEWVDSSTAPQLKPMMMQGSSTSDLGVEAATDHWTIELCALPFMRDNKDFNTVLVEPPGTMIVGHGHVQDQLPEPVVTVRSKREYPSRWRLRKVPGRGS